MKFHRLRNGNKSFYSLTVNFIHTLVIWIEMKVIFIAMYAVELILILTENIYQKFNNIQTEGLI